MYIDEAMFLRSGAELDTLIAEKVLGWKVGGEGLNSSKWYDGKDKFTKWMVRFPTQVKLLMEDFAPSSRLDCALVVIEKLTEKYSNFRLHYNLKGWNATCYNVTEEGPTQSIEIMGKTAALAVCRLAMVVFDR